MISMTPEHWARVKGTFDIAVSLTGDARSSFLDTACGGDDELRRDVESLLSHHETAGDDFLRPVVDLSSPVSSPHASQIGRRIGAYELVAEIGRGGMGEVYRAVRADGQFVKEVALKIVRTGFATPFMLDRFRYERQILAGLDHPNIARLLDGGTTDEGLPYLVMELVDGMAIDAYCDAHACGVVQRLQLFEQVCAAVQYAHQRLVVHRDLKPSNILVMSDGVPKLLDFGIAKIVDSSVSAETTAARPMTLEYASPEQILGTPITTSSDVYALGVVLYRLLTGHSPYAVDPRHSHELARAICEREPIRPTTIRRLPADLDDIVLMALRKEPERRYHSVEQLADDIHRHLRGLPIVARRGSWQYRARKFVGRHGVGVAASVAVALALVVGVFATMREARIARQQAELAMVQKARAEKRFDDVRQFSDSLIFDVHDAIQSLPGATPARKLLLDRAVTYLDNSAKDAAGDPDLQRELAWGYQRLAVVQGNPTESNLGDLDAALASDRKALALFADVAHVNPQNTIDQLNVAMIHRILAFSMLTDPRGRRELDAAMAITDRLLQRGITDPRVRSERSIEYQNLAFLYDAIGDRAHGLEAYRNNLTLKRDIRRTNPDYRLLTRSLGAASILLGSALARVGERDQALKTIDEGIAFYAAIPAGEDRVNTARELALTRQRRGDVLLMNGETDRALALYREAHDELQPMAAADPQNTMLQLDVASMDYQIGRALTVKHQYAAAAERLQRAEALFEKLHPSRAVDDSPRSVVAIDIWLGDANAGRHEWGAALDRYTRATAAAEATPFPDDDGRCELAIGYARTATALAALGRLNEASALYQRALKTVPQPAAAFDDVPALYALADISSGLADLARRSSSADEARMWSEKSRSLWNSIPNRSSVTALGYLLDHPN